MVAAPHAVHAAVLDALAHLGIDQVAMPCSPETVWRALRGAT
jgi:carbon-monoxide dehydrogenase large subunit